MAGDGLLEEIERSGPVGGGCAVSKVLAALDEKDRADLVFALGEPGRFNAEQIARALNNRGFTIKAERVRVHRKKACSCE